MIKIPLADIWVSDSFLAQGIVALCNEVAFMQTKIRFVFFSIDNYVDVKAYKYDQSTHKLILLTTGLNYNFLDDACLYRIDSHISPVQLHSFLTKISLDLDFPKSSYYRKVTLNSLEKVLIEQLCAGKSVIEIALIGNIHYKTAYQHRRNLFKKFDCKSLSEFLNTSRSAAFLDWMLAAPVQ